MVAAWGILVVFGLSDALVAGLGLAIIAAAVPLGILAANLAQRLIWPFSAVAGLLAGTIQAAISNTVGWSQASAEGLGNAISAPFQALWMVASVTIQAQQSLYNAVYRVRYATIPALYAWALAQVTSAYNGAVAHADRVGTTTADYARQLTGVALQRSSQEFAEAVAHADAGLQQAEDYARFAAGLAIARADSEFVRLGAYVEAGLRAEGDYARTLTGDAIAFASAAAADAEAFARGVGADAEGYARALQRQAVDHADVVAGTVAAAAAAATAAVAVRIGRVEDSACQQHCGPLGDLGALLQGLEDDGLLAVLLALVVEAERNPVALQTALRTAVVGPVHEAIDALGLVRGAA